MGTKEETTYKVNIKEVYNQPVIVKADSPEEAIEKAREGEGDLTPELTYTYTLDPDIWTVSKLQRHLPEEGQR